MSRRPLSTKAGAPVIESRMRWTVGRTRCGRRRRRGGRVRAGGAEQVEQVRSFGLVELQGVREAVDHAVGDAGGVAALELGDVLRRDPGQARDLGAAQPRHPAAVSAVHGQPGLLGGDPGPAGGEELADLPLLGRRPRACLDYGRSAGRGSLSVPLYEGLPPAAAVVPCG